MRVGGAVLAVILIALGLSACAPPETLASGEAEPPPLNDEIEPAPMGFLTPPSVSAAPVLVYRGAWEVRRGDSPRDGRGRPLWALPSSRSAEWEDLRPLRELSSDSGRWLWMRTRLSGQLLAEPVLFLYSVDQILAAYVDGALVYRSGEFEGDKALRFPGTRSHLVPLEPPHVGQPLRRVNYEGKVLALRIYSAQRTIGVAGVPRLGGRSEMVRLLFVEDLGRIVVGWMMLLLGAGGVFLFLLRQQERTYLAYGCFALAMGVYTLTQLQVRDLILEAPLLWTHVELGSLHLAALFMAWFIELMFGRGPLEVMRWLRRLLTGQVALAVLAVASGLLPLYLSLPPLQAVILLEAVAVSLTVILAAWRGNTEARIFGGGLLVAAAVSLHDVLASMSFIARTDASWSQYGNAALMLALAGVLGRRFEAVHRRLRDYTQVLQTSLASTRVLVPDERAQVALEQMAQLLGARRTLLFLVAEGQDRLEVRGGHDRTGRPVDGVDEFEQAVVEEVRSRGRALVREAPRTDRRGTRRVLAAPMIFRGSLLGVLLVERGRGGTEEDGLDLLLGLANQVAIVVASSRAMHAEVEAAMTQKRYNEQRALLDAAVRMASGDLSTPILVPIGSPIAHLAESLESMRQDVWTKILQLETKNREVEMLNVELRRQIAQRSRRLIGAILRQQGDKLPPLPDLSPGRIIVGRYRVNKALGQGAMGVVLEVERVADGRRLAAKFVSQRADKQSLLRFMREAQILARLSHPNLIGIFDVDMTAGGVLFMVMELVVGAPLDALHRRYRQLPWALCVLRQVADALAAIHAAGIVHRDLKPANVLVAGGDRQPLPVVKLADFGVSLLLPARSGQPARPSSAISMGGSASALDLIEAEDEEIDDYEATATLDVRGLDRSGLSLSGALPARAVRSASGPLDAPGRGVFPSAALIDPGAELSELGEPWEPPTISLRPGQGLPPGPPALPPAPLGPPGPLDEPSLVGLDSPTLTLKPPVESRAPSSVSVSLSLPPRVPVLQPMSLSLPKPGPKADSLGDSLEAEPSEMTYGSLGAAEVTQSGILIGTPMYMAPENWALGSHHAEPSSDLFSLGVMAFELLAGQLPFQIPPIHLRAQDEDVHVLHLREVRPELAPALCALVDRCLSLNSEERPSASEFERALRELGAQRPQA